MLTVNCPEVDLSTGPRLVQEGAGDSVASTEVVPEIRSGNTNNVDPALTNEFRDSLDDAQPDRLAHEIGLVSVTGGQDPRYIVSCRSTHLLS